jgi:aminocarboxymuconate-semialdehyde decarboxylase
MQVEDVAVTIDVHAHYYPRAYLDAVSRLTEGDVSSWTMGVRRLLTTKIAPERRMVDIDSHIEDMDRAGVDMQVLSLSIPHAYFDDETVAVELARTANDALAEACTRDPSRFKAFATLPLPHVDAALAELDRATGALGLHGVTLGANVKGRHLDDEAFLPLYQEIARRDLTIFLHPMIPPGQEEMVDWDLSASVGFLVDSTLAVLRLAYRGVFEQHPALKFIVPHLGATLPYIMDRVDSSYRTRPENRVHIPHPPSHYLKRLYYDSVNFHPAAWSCALESFGAEHIVLGSDYPFPIGSMERSIERVEALDITPQQREAIYSGTALTLLR